MGARFHKRDHIMDNFLQWKSGFFKFNRARFNFRKIENLVKQGH